MRRLLIPVLLAIAVLGGSVSACVVRSHPGHSRHHHRVKPGHGHGHHKKHRKHKKHKKHKKHRKHKHHH